MEDMALIYTLSPGDDGFLFGNAMKIYANYFSNKSRLMTEVRNRQHKLMKRFVEEHEAKFDPNNIRDYIDICLNEKIKAKSRAERKWFDVEAITANMFLFYTTGVDTSTITLQFGVYLLAKHPSVQERCFEELSSVVGDDVTVKYSDRSRLPYFSAVVNEIYRYSIVAPLPSSRQNSRWTRLEGYDIPAGTLTITNLWSATRDPKHWANGYEFDPNHFYDKYRSRDLSSIHFSLGKTWAHQAWKLQILEMLFDFREKSLPWREFGYSRVFYCSGHDYRKFPNFGSNLKRRWWKPFYQASLDPWLHSKFGFWSVNAFNQASIFLKSPDCSKSKESQRHLSRLNFKELPRIFLVIKL